jgi:dihydroorotate dehydrogenase
MAAMKVKEELRNELVQHGFDSLREAVGYAHRSEGNL